LTRIGPGCEAIWPKWSELEPLFSVTRRFVVPLAAIVLASASWLSVNVIPVRADEPTLLDGFRDELVWSGFTRPTALAIAGDGTVFVAEKSGRIKVFSSLTDDTPTLFADLTTNVHNAWDRGLLGLAVDPDYPSRPYVYALYTYDHILGDAAPAPRWGTAGAENDSCPNPPGFTAEIDGRGNILVDCTRARPPAELATPILMRVIGGALSSIAK